MVDWDLWSLKAMLNGLFAMCDPCKQKVEAEIKTRKPEPVKYALKAQQGVFKKGGLLGTKTPETTQGGQEKAQNKPFLPPIKAEEPSFYERQPGEEG